MILLPIIITITMLLAMFYVIYEVERWRSTRRVLLALYVEGMMLTMNIGGYLYLISNNPFYFLMTNSAYMIFGLYPLLNVKEVKMRRFVYSLFALLMVISEIAMGALIYTLETSIPANIDTSIGNIYFVSVMMVEMAFTLVLSFKNIDKTLRKYLIGLLLFMPWFPQIFPSINLPIWLSAIIMIGDTILIYDSLYKQRLRASQETFTTIELTSIFTLMMIGEFLFFLYGTLIVFDISMIIGMTWFVYRALAGPNPRKGNYTRNPLLAFTIIFLTFIMEFFMGG
ncbi:MAG: 4Fe-4S ferredoxin, partial [Saccharolobus sp.]